MMLKTWYLYLFVILSLSGCIAESDSPKDSDNDGIADKIDCAPENNTQWQLQAYNSIDTDLDGKFTESTGELCIGNELPAQYTITNVSPSESDCDDSNSQLWVLKTYNSIDTDLDGKFTLKSGNVCSGNSLPLKYQLNTTDESQVDCDDTDKEIWQLITAYRDLDNDSFGAGQEASYCIGNQLPIHL